MKGICNNKEKIITQFAHLPTLIFYKNNFIRTRGSFLLKI